MILRLLAIGAISLLGQAVVLRELAVAFYGSELIYALALGGWLLGTAVGTTQGRRTSVPRDEDVRTLLLAFGLALPAVITLARAVRIVLGAVPGGYLPFGRQMLGLVCCVAPPSVLSGLLFRRAAKLWALRGGTFARAYAWESAGAIAGGTVATALLAAGVRNLATGLVCALVAVGAGAWPPWRNRTPRRVAAAVVAGALLVALAASERLDRAMTAWSHPDLVDTRDTPYGRVTVTDRAGQVAVFENDALAYESEGTDAEAFVHLAAIQRERPRFVVVLGGAVPGLVREVLHHAPESVEDLEPDRAVIDVVSSRQPESARKALDDARVHVKVGDPRRLLERAGSVDLVLVAMPEPDSGGANRFYTREFFDVCAQRLGPDGILALRLRGSENVWTPLAARRAASIRGALLEAFADVVVLPGGTTVFLASASPLERDAGVLAERLRSRGPGPRLATPAYVRYVYTNDRLAESAALLARTRVPVNTDRRPVCYAATLLLWLSRFYPTLGSADIAAWEPRDLVRSPWAWSAVALSALLLAAARRRGMARRGVLAGLAGGAGMLLECALLLGYQTRSGVLYRDLGVLMTAFMAGLFLGAAVLDRVGTSRLPRIPTVAGFVALALGSAAWLHAGSPGGLAATSLLLLAAGFVVAALVAHAALHGGPDQARVVAPVYAADVLGGCAGSLLAGLVLIPFAGLPGTAVAAAVVIAAALLA